MTEELVERLLQELVDTRKSFDAAVKTIRWTRINTIIQYGMLFAVVILFILGALNYVGDKRESCDRGNELRVAISDSLDSNASSIGIALVIVTGAEQSKFEEYMDAYNEQNKPSVLKLRNC